MHCVGDAGLKLHPLRQAMGKQVTEVKSGALLME
jgi:hypothetical protein